MAKTRLSLYSSYYLDTRVDSAAVTNYGGIFPYLDLMLLTGLSKSADDLLPGSHLNGWRPSQYLSALLAMNLTGGDCVDDLAKLESDAGIELYMSVISHSIGADSKRFRRGGDRSFPSLTSMREWLENYHNDEEDGKRGYGSAFIPSPNDALRGLREVNRRFASVAHDLMQKRGDRCVSRATLEIDATFVETQKRDALRCYKKFDAYSGLTVRWNETGMVIWEELRDGNVPPSYRNAEALEESIRWLNEKRGVKDVWVRSDSAAHQADVLRTLSEWKMAGEACPVKFAIGYVKSREFREEVQKVPNGEWTSMGEDRACSRYEVAEVTYVSNKEALMKAPPFRHIVVRRACEQGTLPGLGAREDESGDEETMEISGRSYHIHAIVSNIEGWSAREIAEWYNERCGHGEAVHSILKSDLAGGQLPSNRFGVNAAWWSIVVLAHNLHALLEMLALPTNLVGSRFKRLRFHLINVPARLVLHSRRCMVRYFQPAAWRIVRDIRIALEAFSPSKGLIASASM
jgi:hypothetical protein